MFVITQKLVAKAASEWELPADLAENAAEKEAEIKAFIEKGLEDGTIKYADVKACQSDDASEARKALREEFAAAISPLVEALTKSQEKAEEKSKETPPVEPEVEGIGSKVYRAVTDDSAPQKVRARVKGVREAFDNTKKFVEGQEKVMQLPVSEKSGETRSFDGISELEKAVCGATYKHLINKGCGVRTPGWAKMTELDQRLMEYAAHEMRWAGPVGMKSEEGEAEYGWAKSQKLNALQKDVILDNDTPHDSDGLEAVPIVFDDLAILTPLLVGQLFPHVDLRTTTRRRVEGVKLANPDMYWTEEGTTPTEFDTDSFVAAFDTNVHPCVGWMEVGLDVQADSPIELANLIIRNYGQKAALMIENAIATGSGSGEPLGLSNTVGATTVNSDNGATGPPTVGDYIALNFAIPLEYKQYQGSGLNFVANETSYERARAVEVTAGTDQRLVFGQNIDSYNVFGRPYRINHGIGNATIMSAVLRYYIMYRRLGFSVRRVTEDATLAKQNTELLVTRFRMGGQMSQPAAVAVMSDGQS